MTPKPITIGRFAKMSEQAVILTEARRIAKREVKEGWKRQKIKCSHFEAWELTRAADAYLAEHRATLIEEATETVRTDPLFRTLAERYERKRKGKRQ
jgi:hypothetical protein